MKRYLLFSGSNYYPCGGMQDFCDSFDSVVEAIRTVTKSDDEWYHVYDSQERMVVSSTYTTAEYCERYNCEDDERFDTLNNPDILGEGVVALREGEEEELDPTGSY